MKVSVLQDEVANLISVGLKDVAINLAIEFYYYSQDNRYTRLNSDYPRYITSDNVVDFQAEYEDLDVYTQRFRKNLRNVEFSKQYYFGFNSVSELIGKCIRGFFLMVK